jgi:hypothetical protein
VKSLYDQNPASWDKLEANGKPSIKEMSKHFTKCADMNRAINVQGASHWLAGRNDATMKSEKAAKEWLQSNMGKPAEKTTRGKNPMFLVSCDPSDTARLKAILSMIGCEVVEV